MPKIIVFTGSDKDYEAFLKDRIDDPCNSVDFLELILLYNAKIRATQEYAGGEPHIEDEFDSVVVRAADFGSVVSHVISNFATIATQGCTFNKLYVQNPPKQSLHSLIAAFPDEIEYVGTVYPHVEKNSIKRIYSDLASTVLGQATSKQEIAASLYQLSSMRDERPIVLLFYGPSGVGKTETAKCVSEALGGKLTRVQFSMLQNNEAYDYIFGAEHSKGSFARDLLGRESNVVLLDEFDKVNHGLYNAFYELFDEGVFVDSYYRVEMQDALFVLTSNFHSTDEIQSALGPAMFSRISACIEFEDLSATEKIVLVKRHYEKILGYLDADDKAAVKASNIESWFVDHAGSYDNIRTMKTKMERAIFGFLTASMIQGDEAPSS
ncbi:ATPase [Gordonibacter sp. 28C]|uniref:AAA family ATPase n=1 Tax=Gordonibacter sp. 28C TaxID=2078569 RepID=UPI000DF793D3|nr:AAA family ATPase [Gordonibacter sp. 28C]RDB64707.1 ATPase [Gordonibacter sp. 28C]